MAKKFVRGITDVKTINNQDFDTNNVNDLLSDGQYNYIHRKKGKTEEYHNLTDNIKTLSSDNTELLSVTNNNKTTNTATLHPKHDAQKEQLLESTRNTISIHHGENATAEKTTVDTNPQKVLEHENLTVGSGLVKSHTAEQNTTNVSVDFNTVQQKMSASDGVTIDNNTIKLYTLDNYEGDLNEIKFNALVKTAENATNVPQGTRPYAIVDVHRIRNHITQLYYEYHGKCYVRTANLHNTTEIWKDWNTLQYELTSNASIGVNGNALQQLYSQNQTYTHDNGVLKTHVKSLALNTAVATAKEEFNFILKINKGQQSATFTLNEHDKNDFNSIITAYGVDSSVRINGCLFTLSNSTLTVSTDANTGSNLVITFSDILD